VKVRIGYGLGVRTTLNDEGFARVVDALETLRFDSLWLSERIGGSAPDPVVGMAFAAGRTTRLKLGMSVMVLPGRNPVVVAKELATLDRLSGGRLLPAFGLGVADAHEQQAFGVERGERAGWFDEALAVIRACWTDERVTHDGPRFHYDGLRVEPKPRQTPPDVWLGGIAPSELRRVGRLADGWLPSFITPEDAAAGRAVIEQVAEEHGREIEDEHYGALVPYTLDGVPDATLAALAARRPDLADPTVLVPSGWDALVRTVERFVGAGTSKFVVVPVVEPRDAAAWEDHLAAAADVLLPLQKESVSSRS
jgi:probable F420-dependent oxidoreductase